MSFGSLRLFFIDLFSRDGRINMHVKNNLFSYIWGFINKNDYYLSQQFQAFVFMAIKDKQDLSVTELTIWSCHLARSHTPSYAMSENGQRADKLLQAALDVFILRYIQNKYFTFHKQILIFFINIILIWILLRDYNMN